jgi:hypothetical protein
MAKINYDMAIIGFIQSEGRKPTKEEAQDIKQLTWALPWVTGPKDYQEHWSNFYDAE